MDQQEKVEALEKALKRRSESNATEVPQHLLTMIAELHTTNNKLLECPICLNSINKKTLTSSKCGHLYCKDCMDKLKKEPIDKKKCAVCRKAL
jgi:late competence protein required for DNA uptake (superfamily II DNA/RNA helicase)